MSFLGCVINGEQNLKLPTIKVTEPRDHSIQGQRRYTSYLIVIDTDHPAFNVKSSAIRRRFSGVLWLHTVLKSIHKSVKIPKAPPRKITSDRFDPEFIERRRELITSFLNAVINTQTLISDSAVHLFLQSELSTREIDAYFQGDLSQERIDHIWAQGGLLNAPSKHRQQASVSTPNEISENSDHHTELSSCCNSRTNTPLLDGYEGSTSSEAKSPPLSNCCSSRSSSSNDNSGEERFDSVDHSPQNNHPCGALHKPVEVADCPSDVIVGTVAEMNSLKIDPQSKF